MKTSVKDSIGIILAGYNMVSLYRQKILQTFKNKRAPGLMLRSQITSEFIQ